jgi:hypothetical protein
MAARRQQVQKARVAIGLSSAAAPGGGVRSGGPINPAGPAAPTPDQPAVSAAPAAAPAPGEFHPDNVPEMSSRDDMLKATEALLKQAANRGQAVAPTPAVATQPPAAPTGIQDQIAAVGAENMSPEMQFMRVAGRVPSGREMAMFAATSELARQLGRNPTTNELMMYMTRPVAPASPAMIPGVNA